MIRNHSSFYPFAEFSPEWQAISYARKNNIHVRFMDLPMTHHIALEKEVIERLKKEEEEKKAQEGEQPGAVDPSVNNYSLRNNEVVEVLPIRKRSHFVAG